MAGGRALPARVRTSPVNGASATPPGEPRRVGYLYILPALVIYGLFLLFPLGHSFWLSLFEWDGQTLGTWTGIDNYVAIVQDEELRTAFGHAATLIMFYSVLPIVLALGLTATMSRAKVRGLTFFRTALFMPQVIAMVVVATAWSSIYSPDGVLNTVLRAIGLGGITRAWLGDFTWALPSVGLIGTWVEIGLAVVLFMAGVQRIPNELYEAARLDGAGPVREFFAITLPSLRGEISVAMSLTIIAALRTFDLVYVATRGGPANETSVPAFEVYHRAFETNEVGSACAIGVTLAVLMLFVTVVVTRLVEGGRS